MLKEWNKTLEGVENILFLNCGNLTKLIKLYISKDANVALCKFLQNILILQKWEHLTWSSHWMDSSFHHYCHLDRSHMGNILLACPDTRFQEGILLEVHPLVWQIHEYRTLDNANRGLKKVDVKTEEKHRKLDH